MFKLLFACLTLALAAAFSGELTMAALYLLVLIAMLVLEMARQLREGARNMDFLNRWRDFGAQCHVHGWFKG